MIAKKHAFLKLKSWLLLATMSLFFFLQDNAPLMHVRLDTFVIQLKDALSAILPAGNA